jgi:hypothetical protein
MTDLEELPRDFRRHRRGNEGGEMSDLEERLLFLAPNSNTGNLMLEAVEKIGQLYELLLEARDVVDWVGCSKDGYREACRQRDAFIEKLDAVMGKK